MPIRLLVTGGKGLIGSHVCRLLPRSEFEWILAEEVLPGLDLLQPGAWLNLARGAQPDSVLHLAWKASGTLSYRTHVDNQPWVAKSREMIRYCSEHGINFYGTGTVAEIEKGAADAYSVAKKQLWKLSAAEVDAGTYTWFRPHYVFDPNSVRPALMAEILQAKHENRTANIHRPKAMHDFIHVEDVAAGIVKSIQAEIRGLVELGSGKSRSVHEFAKASGVGIEQASRTDGFSPVSHVADTSLLRSLGWNPTNTNMYFGNPA